MATLNFKLAPKKNKAGRYIIKLHIVAGCSNTAVNSTISVEKKSDWLEKQQKVRLNPKANVIQFRLHNVDFPTITELKHQ